MNDFDKYIKDEAEKEPIEIPDNIKKRIEQTLEELPEKENSIKHIKLLPKIVATAAAFFFVLLFLLPNVSVTYAKAIQQVPVIGDIVRVFTVRNYFYSDDKREMDIKVPKIEGSDSEAIDYINKNVSELTAILVNRFYQDLELSDNTGYGSITVNYEIVTNTERWFTLKLSVSETAASSNHYFVFYHIDKKQGKIVKLGDLFRNEEYSDILAAQIKKQMKERMENDRNASYWINDSIIGEEFASVEPDRNFYWNKDGNLVIVFDKYEVGPGSMGAPEFIIDKPIIKELLKPEFSDIVV